MKSNRWTVAGPVAAHDLGMGTWRLVAGGDAGGGAPPPAEAADFKSEILIRGAGADAVDCFEGPIARLTVEWGPGWPKVSVTRAGLTRVMQARSVFVHEARPQLYDSLPLAKFDADARRFWGRIFRVIRLPGGRWLLKVLARRKRG